jgi:hypothetical protein
MKTGPARTLQTVLGFTGAEVDGQCGVNTYARANAALQTLAPAATGDWRTWPDERKGVLCLQAYAVQSGFNPGDLDGLWGPQTEHACGELSHLLATGAPPVPWRKEEVPPNPNTWPLEREAELRSFYGPPGEASLVALDLPYPLRLAWDPATSVTRLRCHTKVKASLGRVFAAVLLSYGLADLRAKRLDLFGGGYNFRQKRGGSTMSTHAWGIALDFDPDKNQLAWKRERASFARPEYDLWWRCWEDEGWISLGRTRNYDWMHVQAARI